MKKLLFIILLIIAFYPGNGLAQEVSPIARFDTTDILIGDQIDLNISFTMPLDYRVLWPHYKDTLTRNIEIVSMSPVDTLINESENIVEMLQSLTITSFDSGYYYVPPIKFQYQPIDDTVFTEASTIPLYLKVHTMQVDTTQAIKPIKPPLGAPLTFREILPWLLAGLGALIVIILAIYIYTRWKKNKPLFRIRPKIILPPHVVAMNGLENLKGKKLWQAGKVKDYYTELTDILRNYIEDRYDVTAVEMTTDEILEGLKNTDAPKESVDKLARTLVLADLVKFAKENPLPLDNDISMNSSIEFVKTTRSEREIEEIMEKIRIENGKEIIEGENNGGSSFAKASEDDGLDNKKEEKE
ncbi:MAG: hypothetical protein V2I47_00075 [Bacteroidales bacterium]|jgi:hypothetical protein|nr:hypothetical protein [Bacteroidales bacterium]